jgi:hypothetical protein
VKLISGLLTSAILTNSITLGRTASQCGVSVFYRKLITYVLLTLYGVPAVIGPHWHSHQCDVACELACVSLHDLCPTAASNLCSCNHDHSKSCDEPSSNTHLVQIVGSDTDSENCSICHFYSCTPFVGVAHSIVDRVNLVESLVVAPKSQPCSLYQIHFARGPPSA